MKRLIPVLLVLGLAGCSQVDALAPVGGDNVSMVRFAANDLLVGAGIELMTAPVCTESNNTETNKVSTCEGKTMAGERIAVRSEGDHLTVTVGPRSLYDGSLQSVITENGQPR